MKPSGHVAIIHTNHVSDEQGDAFYHASQAVYDKYYADNGKGALTLPVAAAVQPSELDPALFRLVDFARFPMVINYTAHEYAQLLNTYSVSVS
jgi:hypothetical protein